jgi:hypothetical protein
MCMLLQEEEKASVVIKTKPRTERNRVLVTGGAGFVVSHLCEFLVKRGDHVSKTLVLMRPAAPCGAGWLFFAARDMPVAGGGGTR